jgi:hypothetical protein
VVVELDDAGVVDSLVAAEGADTELTSSHP